MSLTTQVVVIVTMLFLIAIVNRIAVRSISNNTERFREETAKKIEINRLANELVRKKVRDGEYDNLADMAESVNADVKFYEMYFSENLSQDATISKEK